MANKVGFAALNTNLNSSNFVNSLPKEDLIFSARVTDIVLDDSHPDFQNYGSWNGVGTIIFEDINNANNPNIENTTIATPLLPQIKHYPLKNEIVLIFRLPPRDLSSFSENYIYYYLSPLSLWNHPHHNAYPNIIKSKLTGDAQTKDYTSIEQGGQVRRVKDNSTEIDLNPPSGGTFVERINIHPLLAYAGDNIVEGRFGNSLRLGNTSKTTSQSYKNNWSGEGENGDPITILRNGQPVDASEKGWEPIIENINKDLSSIYLTSTQKIPLQTDIKDFTAISTNPPESYTSYSGNQIILNSGRLILNSSLDSILLSSQSHISFSSINDIGVFSKQGKINLKANQVNLGDTVANESVILGDSFTTQLNTVLSALNSLCTALQSEPYLGPASIAAGGVKTQIQNLQNKMGDFLSKTVKTV